MPCSASRTLPRMIDALDETEQPLAIEGGSSANGDGGRAPPSPSASAPRAGTRPRYRRCPPRRRATQAPRGPPPEQTAIPADPVTEPAIAKRQLDRLHAALRETGITDREAGLGLITDWAGRKDGGGNLIKITTTADLTAAEARVVLDHLEALRKAARKPGDADDVPPPDQEPPRDDPG